MSRIGTFFLELRRRKVWLVGGVYIVSAWIIAQVASLVLPNFAVPPWVMPVLLIVLGLGLPLAIILAWAQETQGAAADEPEAAPATDSDRPAIAVLPFTNMSSDEDQEYMADGMTEDVITLLSQASNIDVTARNSVFAYKGQSPDIRDVGRALNVNFVAEGSIRRVGETVRCTVQLIDVATGNHIWAQQFDRPTDEFFHMQDEIVSEIALKVTYAVSNDLRIALRQRDDMSLDVWGLIVRSYDLVMGVPEDIERALVLLGRALETEPENAMAHGSTARWLSCSIAWSLSDDPKGDEQKAREHLRIALSNGRNQADVMYACATTLRFLGDQEESLELIQSMYSRRIGHRETEAGLALLLAGRLEEGLEILEEQNARLGQNFPLGPGLAHGRLLAGQYGASEEAARDAVTREHFRLMGSVALANALGMQGKLDEARAAWAQALQLREHMSLEIIEHYAGTLWANPDHAAKLTEGVRRALEDA